MSSSARPGWAAGGHSAETGGGPDVGALQWFHLGDRASVERVTAALGEMGIRHLRTGVSWADWYAPGGRDWYDWLLPQLGRSFEVLPCILYTPPSLGILPKTSSPPKRPRDYADFVDLFLGRHGDLFTHVELWNEPNNLAEWDWTLDPEWNLFADMVGAAASWTRRCGFRTVLGGMAPPDPNWLDLMCARGLVEHIDVVGIHAFPGAWEATWLGWEPYVGSVQQVLDRRGSEAAIWITETGFSTWAHQEHKQLRHFLAAAAAPVERMYWYGVEDLHEDEVTSLGFHTDDREYHFGVTRSTGEPKLLGRALQAGGLRGAARFAALGDGSTAAHPDEPATLITGGAGFVGTNLADRLASEGTQVIVYDNLSRPGVEQNLEWLKDKHGERVTAEIGDLRDRFTLRPCVEAADRVFHLAAQVAVTTSITDPMSDFRANLEGTMNLLEEVRRAGRQVPFLFTSTNKVYGALPDVKLEELGSRYEPTERDIRERGIGEDRPLSFCSPYGCSKGGADQYVIDYCTSFGLPSTVFRMSCIYGPHQFGTEDQGWVAHFLIKALEGRPLTLYGDGKQVRDILFVDDLVDALLLAMEDSDRLAGQAFNIGGGTQNQVSLLEVMDMIAALHGTRPESGSEPWRIGDQRYYVSDTSRFEAATGWRPKVGVAEGIDRLYRWLAENRRTPAELRAEPAAR